MKVLGAVLLTLALVAPASAATIAPGELRVVTCVGEKPFSGTPFRSEDGAVPRYYRDRALWLFGRGHVTAGQLITDAHVTVRRAPGTQRYRIRAGNFDPVRWRGC